MASKELLNLMDECIENQIIKKYVKALNLSCNEEEELSIFVKSYKYDIYELDQICSFLISKGMSYNDLVDIPEYRCASFNTKKYVYELILPHEDIGNLYLLRRGKIKDFDRWANSTDGELFFKDSIELEELFDNKKEWQNWRLNNLVRTISRRMK